MKAHGTVHKYGDNVDTTLSFLQDTLIQPITRSLQVTVWRI